jgi:sporulation protein YlmC with PRC-barrel domain
MLRSVKSLEGYEACALDGRVGTVADFLFEDTSWVVRYLVVKTSSSMVGGRALIAPMAFGHVDYSASRFRLLLSMAMVEDSPGMDADAPVSRQKEREYYGYYGYPLYWNESPEESFGAPAPDAHLRSAREVADYRIEASDGSIGHVRDVIVDDDTWAIEYLVVATANGWPAKSVLIAPAWASRIDWLERRIHVQRTRDEIRSSPEWTATYPVDRLYAEQLYRHYAGIPGWAGRDRNVLASSERPRAAEVQLPRGEKTPEELLTAANARVAAREEAQVLAADRAVVADARAGRMP